MKFKIIAFVISLCIGWWVDRKVAKADIKNLKGDSLHLFGYVMVCGAIFLATALIILSTF